MTVKIWKRIDEEERGAYDYVIDTNSGITVVRWFYKAAVKLASTHICC